MNCQESSTGEKIMDRSFAGMIAAYAEGRIPASDVAEALFPISQGDVMEMPTWDGMSPQEVADLLETLNEDLRESEDESVYACRAARAYVWWLNNFPNDISIRN